MTRFIKINYVSCLLAILPSTAAFGYSRVQTSQGADVHWPQAKVTVQRDSSFPSTQLTDEQAQKALQAALDAWSTLPDSHIQLARGADAPDPTAQGSTPTLNFVRFRQSDWPYAHTMLAYTQLFTHPKSGEIVAAMIEVNEQDNHFFGPDDMPSHASNLYDLQAVLTHEMGHLIGLGHSDESAATMYRSTAPFDTHQRTPIEDDRLGVTTIYPQSTDGGSEPDPAPTTLPAHGCSIGAKGSADGQVGSALLVALTILGMALVRSRKQSASAA